MDTINLCDATVLIGVFLSRAERISKLHEIQAPYQAHITQRALKPETPEKTQHK